MNYKIFTTALEWVQERPAITISDALQDAPELAMRFAETFAQKGYDTVLTHDTGNPDLPMEVIHYIPRGMATN